MIVIQWEMKSSLIGSIYLIIPKMVVIFLYHFYGRMGDKANYSYIMLYTVIKYRWVFKPAYNWGVLFHLDNIISIFRARPKYRGISGGFCFLP